MGGNDRHGERERGGLYALYFCSCSRFCSQRVFVLFLSFWGGGGGGGYLHSTGALYTSRLASVHCLALEASRAPSCSLTSPASSPILSKLDPPSLKLDPPSLPSLRSSSALIFAVWTMGAHANCAPRRQDASGHISEEWGVTYRKNGV